MINTINGTTKVTYKVEGINQSRAVCFNPSGNKLAVGGSRLLVGEQGIKIISISNSDNRDQNASVLYWLKGSSPDHGWPHGGPGPSVWSGVFSGIDWSVDGKLIAAAGRNIRFKTWDAISGLVKYGSSHFGYRLFVRKEVAKGVSFSPTGEKLMGSSYQNVVIMDSLTGEKLHRLLGHSGHVNSVAWSPNGKYVVSGGQGVCNDELVTIWDAEKGLEILTFTGPKRDLPPIKKGSDHPISECVSVAWSPDGTKLAYAVKIHHRKSDQLKGNHISVNEQGEYATEHYIQVWDFPNDNNTSGSSSNTSANQPTNPPVTQPTNPATTGKELKKPSKQKTEPKAGATPKSSKAGSIVSYDKKFGFYVINRGTDHGIKNGDEFSVFRAGKMVGKIQIKQAQPTVSIAEAIEELTPKQLQRQDKLQK